MTRQLETFRAAVADALAGGHHGVAINGGNMNHPALRELESDMAAHALAFDGMTQLAQAAGTVKLTGDGQALLDSGAPYAAAYVSAMDRLTLAANDGEGLREALAEQVALVRAMARSFAASLHSARAELEQMQAERDAYRDTLRDAGQAFVDTFQRVRPDMAGWRASAESRADVGEGMGAGRVYRDGSWLSGHGGEWYTLAGNEETSGSLDHCERWLWDRHAKANEAQA